MTASACAEVWIAALKGEAPPAPKYVRLDTYSLNGQTIEIIWHDRQILEVNVDGKQATLTIRQGTFYGSKPRGVPAGAEVGLQNPPGEARHLGTPPRIRHGWLCQSRMIGAQPSDCNCARGRAR